ncbi:putative hydrolase [Gordonia effusa NBRC 100432]|uniref:Putative hydrolase n=1 Tax=Gordonia effusa NBRC 100432 TaxID=1077974 RepID=H0R3D6_9ACTN|nr:alpha/beta hydrolase [Gordonia effusa]GAB19587.1 putative hydrolase [Gordonia effusa NBRC 100432]
MTARYQYADVRGARLAWNSTGSGSPVVWAHGIGSAATTQEAAGHFDWRPISKRHRLIRYDARGHGHSSGGLTPTEYTWPELGADLLALLDVVAGSGQVDAVGTSMGTASIVYAALAQPDRFRRLVLTTPPTIWDTRPGANLARLASAKLLEDKGLAALQALNADQPASPALVGARRYVTPVRVRAAQYAAVLRGSAQTDLPAAKALESLDKPTLILSWTGDPSHPVSSAEALASALPNAELVVASTPQEHERWGELAATFLSRG